METITINNCPLCGKSHTYDLKVERSFVMKWTTGNDSPESQNVVRLTRFFICPEKKENFQGVLSLYETPSERIKAVDVIGITKAEIHE